MPAFVRFAQRQAYFLEWGVTIGSFCPLSVTAEEGYNENIRKYD